MEQTSKSREVYVVVLAQPGLMDKYRDMEMALSKQLSRLGKTHIVVGIFCFICQSVNTWLIAESDRLSIGLVSFAFAGYGFWIGIIFIITGVYGILAAYKKKKCEVSAFNVLSIISLSFASIMTSITVASAVSCRSSVASQNNSNNTLQYQWMVEIATAMDASTAFLGLVEGIIAILSSAVCCTIGACCCSCGGSCCCPSEPPYNKLSEQPEFVQLISSDKQQPVFLLNPYRPSEQSPKKKNRRKDKNPPSTPSDLQKSVYTTLTPDEQHRRSYAMLEIDNLSTELEAPSRNMTSET